MLLGLNLAVFSDRSLMAALERASRLGLDAIEINVEETDALTPLSSVLKAGNARSIRRACAEFGLTISGVGNHQETQLIGGPHHSDTDRIHRGDVDSKVAYGKAQLLRTARAAVELECRTVIGFVGCEDWSRWFPWPDPEGFEKMVPRFVETWMPLLDELNRLGVRFAHEPHPKQLVYDLESAVLVNKAVDGHPAWGYNLDVANIGLAGVDASAFIQELPDRILHVHAKDIEFPLHNAARSGWQSHGAWDRPDRGVRFRVPGWGQLDWKRILSELQLCRYSGTISIEHEDPIFSRDEGVDQAVSFLRPLIIRRAREARWW